MCTSLYVHKETREEGRDEGRAERREERRRKETRPWGSNGAIDSKQQQVRCIEKKEARAVHRVVATHLSLASFFFLLPALSELSVVMILVRRLVTRPSVVLYLWYCMSVFYVLYCMALSACML
ncbi:hypothetical protein BZA77DRAFT_320910 [Pyronema omphalodes]|nr:hypothetical protein BZA77DRAFT_320910 [Pyronema omphalodes]